MKVPNPLRQGRPSYASALEVIGVALLCVGLWSIHPVAALIGIGVFCILIAQGIQRGGEE